MQPIPTSVPPANPTRSTGDTELWGGLGASTDPNAYQVVNPMATQVNQMFNRGAIYADPKQQAQFRDMQMQQAQQLQRIASGQQQGAGELAVQRQMQNAVAAQQAQARMARGGNSGLAYRQAANNTANMGLAGAGQAQQAQLQDQQQAQQALMASLNQGRSGDLNLATTNANLQAGQYGQQLGALTSMNNADLQAQQQAMQSTLDQKGIAGGLFSAGGGVLAALSDERAKTDISDADGDIDDMLDKLVAKSYRYKDEAKHGAGERAGIMTQDLMRSKAGSALVIPTEEGFAFDVSKAVSAALASTARLNQRLREIEKRG